jgi:hypothetical protein
MRPLVYSLLFMLRSCFRTHARMQLEILALRDQLAVLQRQYKRALFSNASQNALSSFAEILPRFISKRTSHKPHKRIFSDRDLLFYWLHALGKVGAGTSLVFITPRSAVRSRPPLPYRLLIYRTVICQTLVAKLPRSLPSANTAHI